MRRYPATREQLLAWIAADKRVLEMGHLPLARVRMLTAVVAENEARLAKIGFQPDPPLPSEGEAR